MKFDVVLDVSYVGAEQRPPHDSDWFENIWRETKERRRERDRVYGPGIRKGKDDSMRIVREICGDVHVDFKEGHAGWSALTLNDRKRPVMTFTVKNTALWFGIRGVSREGFSRCPSVSRVNESRAGLVCGRLSSVEALIDLAPLIKKAVVMPKF